MSNNNKFSEEYLAKIRAQLRHGEATAAQVAAALDFSSEGVRRCLKGLCDIGAAKAVTRPSPSGRFTVQFYQLVAEGPPPECVDWPDRILDVLADGPASVFELCAELGGAGSTMLAQLRKLVDEGIVERCAHYTGRSKEAHVTRYELARTKPIVGSLRRAA